MYWSLPNQILFRPFPDQKKNLKEVEELLIGNRPTINRYMKCRKRRVSVRQLEKKKLQVAETERGSFTPLPVEVCCLKSVLIFANFTNFCQFRKKLNFVNLDSQEENEYSATHTSKNNSEKFLLINTFKIATRQLILEISLWFS